MITAMIVEDNAEDTAKLQRILSKLQPELTFITLKDGVDAMEALNACKSKVDIFFVDRDLPIMDGFAFVEQIRRMPQYVMTPIVFVTGYEMGQLSAFQGYHCYSYIVKPIQFEWVEIQIGDLLDSLGSKRKHKELKKVINLSAKDGVRMVYAEDILGIEVIRRDCCVYVGKDSYLLSRQALETVLQELDDPYCIRCHKSFAISVRHVIDLKKARRNIWLPRFKEETAFVCEISKTYYDKVVECYRQYMAEELQ